MTRIDFYVLPDANPKARELLACKLTRKAVQKGYRVFVHTASESQTKQMDDLMWTFAQDSFVAHTTQAEDLDDTPVFIDHACEPHGIHDMLINLNPQTPNCFSRFERMAELLHQQDDVLKAGRDRYRFYQDRGYPLQTHKL